MGLKLSNYSHAVNTLTQALPFPNPGSLPLIVSTGKDSIWQIALNVGYLLGWNH